MKLKKYGKLVFLNVFLEIFCWVEIVALETLVLEIFDLEIYDLEIFDLEIFELEFFVVKFFVLEFFDLNFSLENSYFFNLKTGIYRGQKSHSHERH